MWSTDRFGAILVEQPHDSPNRYSAGAMGKPGGKWTGRELILLGALVGAVLVLWGVTVASGSTRREQLSAAGDAVAAIGAVLAGVATVIAVRTMRDQRQASEEQQGNTDAQIATMEDQVKVQREALKEQRQAFDQQIEIMRTDQRLQHAAIDLQRQAVAEQRAAIVEDHRQQRLARIQEAYAEAITKLSLFALAAKTATEVWDDTQDRTAILRDSLDGLMVSCAVAASRCDFIDHHPERYSWFKSAFDPCNSGFKALYETLAAERPSNLAPITVDIDPVEHKIRASIRDEIERQPTERKPEV